MGVQFISESPLTGEIADKDYFLTINGELTDSEETAHVVLIRKGQGVTKFMSETYGIPTAPKAAKAKEKVAQPDAEEKSETPKENKKETPSENKKGAK